MALRVADEIFTNQLRNTLIAGTNISFVHVNDRQTRIDGLGGGGIPIVLTNPQANDLIVVANNANQIVNKTLETSDASLLSITTTNNTLQLNPHCEFLLQTFAANRTYLPNLREAFMYEGNVYGTDENAIIVWRNNCIDESNKLLYLDMNELSSYNNSGNLLTLPLYSTKIPLVSLKSTQSTHAQVIEQTSNHVNFPSSVRLKFPHLTGLSNYSSHFEWDSDFSLIFAISCSSLGNNSSSIFGFDASDKIYNFDIEYNSEYRNHLCINCAGELHPIPVASDDDDEFNIICVRLTHVTAFRTHIDAFVNGTRQLSSYVDDTLTQKSLGLANLPYFLGHETFPYTLAYFACYANALSDSECIQLTRHVNFYYQLDMANFQQQIIPYSSYRTMALSQSSPLVPLETNITNHFTFISTNTSPTLLFSSSSQPYRLKFSNNNSNLVTSVDPMPSLLSPKNGLTIIGLVALPLRNETTTYNPILTLLLDNNVAISVGARYNVSTSTIRFQLTTNTQQSSAEILFSDDTLCNEFLVSLSLYQNKHAYLSIWSLKNQESFDSVYLEYENTNSAGLVEYVLWGGISTGTNQFYLGPFEIYNRLINSFNFKKIRLNFISEFNLPLQQSSLE